MKKIILITTLLTFSTISFSQKEEEKETGKFKRENIFLGGSIGLNAGGWNNTFFIGANPQIGYSIANFLDAGIITNLNYFSLSYNQGGFDYKQSSFNYGAGVFLKLYPINQFHIQGQYEYNWIASNVTQKQTGLKQKFLNTSPSLLLGAGYGRRIIGETSFFTTVLFDVSKNLNSPYIDSYGDAIPVIRTGVTFYLKPKSQK